MLNVFYWTRHIHLKAQTHSCLFEHPNTALTDLQNLVCQLL